MQQRLDQLENEFEMVKELLMSAARYAESANRGLDRLELAQQQTQTQLDQLGVRVDALTANVGGLALQLEQQAQQAEQDRSQAAIDRAEFRSTVTQLLEVLAQQFNGNGRSGE